MGQTITSGSDLFFGSSREVSSVASGAFFAPTACAAAYSAGSLTSISTPFSRLMICTASAADTRPAPPAWESIGMSSSAPEAIAAAKRYQFWRMKSKGLARRIRSQARKREL